MLQTVGNQRVQCVEILGSFLANLRFRSKEPYKQNPLLETNATTVIFSMKKTFYEKVGRKYVPVYEYDSELLASLPRGAHLIICNPNSTSYRYNIDPDYASLIAAAHAAEDVLANAIISASAMKLDNDRELTPEQLAAWQNMVCVFGDRGRTIQYPAAQEIAVKGLKALVDKAKTLTENAAVNNALEQLKLLCKLVEQQNGQLR